MARLCDFPEEVLEEIMSWLPPESLKRFKCVCKLWNVLINSLIKDPGFVAKHLRNMTINMVSSPVSCFWELLAIDHPEPEEKDSPVAGTHLLTMASHDFEVNECVPCVNDGLKFLVHDLDYSFKLVSHCDGILCLYTHYGNEFISLLNPALKEFKIVLNGHLGDDFSINAVGFGYDSKANDYKVVIIKSPLFPMAMGDGPYEAALYTLSTNSWKEIDLGVEIVEFPTYEHQTLYCNGVCYWYYWQFWCRLISFHVGDDMFHSIPLPDNVILKRVAKEWESLIDWSKIAVWNNSVVLFFYVEEGPAVIDMWVMDSHSDGVEVSYAWTKQLTIGPLVGVKCPLAFWDNDVLFLETEDCEIISYSLRIQLLTDLAIRFENLKSDCFVIYTRSLVSVLKREGKSLTVEAIHPTSGPSSSENSITL